MARDKKYFEPGTLDQTRKNIGEINKEEAAHMMKVLGGEVIQERSKHIASPAVKPAKKQIQGPVTPIKQMTAAEAAAKASVAQAEHQNFSAQRVSFEIKNISPSDWALLDKTMMSPEYRMKTDYGFFNFVRFLQKNGMMRLDRTFVRTILSRHLSHLDAFITLSKTLISLSPNSFKSKTENSDDLKYRFLRKISSWTLTAINRNYDEFRAQGFHLQMADAGPFIKNLYGMLVQVLFLGDRRVIGLLKEIYEELLSYPDIKRSAIASTVKDIASEWSYIYNQIIKGMYPLLYAFIGGPFVSYELFFSQKATEILKFTGKARFDVLLPVIEVHEDAENTKNDFEEEAPKSTEKKEEKSPEEIQEEKRKNELFKMGIKILETLFPQAGFSRLSSYPDLYPYFQPLYDFPDGFNLLSPENPMQVIIVLLRILEDFFHGCRNIQFTHDADSSIRQDEDTISSVLDEWSVYQEILFDKYYAQPLKDFVSEQYTKRDFVYSHYGKTLQNKLFWMIKYYFLPAYSFDKLVLERPEFNNNYKPLASRVKFIINYFSEIARAIDSNKNRVNSAVTGMKNPWEHYSFDISNPVSKRLDVMLCAKRTDDKVTATNANIIKYALCITAVLDWWVNDYQSPAYKTNPFNFYRISPEDGGPVFTVPLRTDQDKLFKLNLKRIAEQKNAAKAKGN